MGELLTFQYSKFNLELGMGQEYRNWKVILEKNREEKSTLIKHHVSYYEFFVEYSL